MEVWYWYTKFYSYRDWRKFRLEDVKRVLSNFELFHRACGCNESSDPVLDW
jgi:hypothetical protein